MKEKKIDQPQTQETLSSQTSPELPTIRTESQVGIETPDSYSLLAIKDIYESWLPEDHHDVTLKQALTLIQNNCQTSNLVKKDSKKLLEVKDAASQIAQEHHMFESKLLSYYFVTGYGNDILGLFDKNKNLKKSFLKNLFEEYPDFDAESHQKRQEAVFEAIKNGKAFNSKVKNKDLITDEPTCSAPITETKKTPRTTLDQLSVESLSQESSPSFEGRSLIEKFNIINGIKKAYLRGSQTNQNTQFLTAVQLVQFSHEDNPTKQEILSSKPEVIPGLAAWFKMYLPEFGINDINDISYESFRTFSNINPNIINLFDDADPENKLSQTTFEIIAHELTGQYQKLQQFIPQFLLGLSVEDRSNESIIRNFIKQCKIGFNFNDNNEKQIKRISGIYSDVKGNKTTTSTSEMITRLFQ